MEAAPEGTVDMFATVDGSKEVQIKWLAPNKPQGQLIYTVFVTGLFYADQGIFFFILLSLMIALIFCLFFFFLKPLTFFFSIPLFILEIPILFFKNYCYDLWCIIFVQTHTLANEDKPSALI